MQLDKFANVEKGWGYEIIIANSPLYCTKILCVNAGKKNSWHYHEKKDETFFCLEGKATLYYSLSDCMVEGKFEPSLAQAMILEPGVKVHLFPGMRHRIVAEERTLLTEGSTEHFDSDSIRLEPGD